MPMHIPFLPRLFSRLNNLVPPVLLHTKRQLSSLEIFGEMIGSQVVTSGQCAEPETLLREGFEFQYPGISTFFNKAFPVKS